MPAEENLDNFLDEFLEPVDKDENKAKMVEELQSSFDHGGTPFIDYCKGYVYLAYADGDEWQEYSYVREDGNLNTTKRDAETQFHVIKEEIIRGLSEIVEDLNVNQVNELGEKAANDPQKFIDSVIAELDAKVPIIRSKDEIQKAIDMVQNS